MRYFTVSEEWGPFPCEHPDCTEQEVYTIRLTDEESERLLEKSGSKAVSFIFNNKLGTAVCTKHR